MDTQHPDPSMATPLHGAAASPSPERRRPTTTQEARKQALHDAILTQAGFDRGYVVLQPSRWLWRFWLEFERFNQALQRVEAQSLPLLDNRQTDFRPHLDAFLAVLADYRATTRRLTHYAHTLASARVKELEPLTQQVAGAWRDDPPPPAYFDDPSPDDGPRDDPSLEAQAGAETPPPVPDLTTLFGPSLAAERAAAQAGEPG